MGVGFKAPQDRERVIKIGNEEEKASNNANKLEQSPYSSLISSMR